MGSKGYSVTRQRAAHDGGFGRSPTLPASPTDRSQPATHDPAGQAFALHDGLTRALHDDLGRDGGDGAHDLAHILRVWRNAAAIAELEAGCDMEVLVAATILHDCVAVAKNSPDRLFASRLAAARASEVMALRRLGTDRAAVMADAIAAHSFSAGVAPETVEARILQDADRLDAIGAIGVARYFDVGGRLGFALYDHADPLARDRTLDDGRFSLDHFETKLFTLAEGFQTAAGREMAQRRDTVMRNFVAELQTEIGV